MAVGAGGAGCQAGCQACSVAIRGDVCVRASTNVETNLDTAGRTACATPLARGHVWMAVATLSKRAAVSSDTWAAALTAFVFLEKIGLAGTLAARTAGAAMMLPGAGFVGLACEHFRPFAC